MSTNPSTEHQQLVLNPQTVELRLGEDELTQGTAVTSPPVTRLRELRGNDRIEWKTTARHVGALSSSELQVAEAEFARLLTLYERHKSSASYLAKLASLARVIGDKVR